MVEPDKPAIQMSLDNRFKPDTCNSLARSMHNLSAQQKFISKAHHNSVVLWYQLHLHVYICVCQNCM